MEVVPYIHHVQMAIPPNSEDIARYFFSSLLGLPEIAKPAQLQSRGGVWLQTGNLQLHLGVEMDFQPARKAHVAFLVSDIDLIRERLALAGLPTVDDEPLAGYVRFYTNDPFGNRIELVAIDKSLQ